MRRLNVKLLLWVVGTAIASVFLITGMWFFQTNRTAGSLLTRADRLAKEKNYLEALKEYDRYFKFREDDVDNYVRFAMLHDEFATLPNSTDPDRARALKHLRHVLVKDPSRQDVRRKAVDHLLHWRVYNEAMAELKTLLAAKPNDAELESLLADCHVMNNEVEKAVELYQKSIAHDPKRVASYASLARLQRSRLGKPADADKTIEQLVERNPDNHEALIERARMLRSRRTPADNDAAAKDIAQALGKAPTDPMALMFSAEIAVEKGDLELARRNLDSGLKAHPENVRLIVMAARLEASQRDLEKAEGILKDGIKRIPKDFEMLFELANLQLGQVHVDDAKKTLETMRKRQMAAPFLKYVESRILMAEKNYTGASKLLEEIRAPLTRTTYAKEINVYLSQCYMALGQLDRQLTAAQQAYEIDSDWMESRLTLAMALETNHQRPEAIKQYMTLQNLPGIPVKIAQMLIELMSEKPKTERVWDDAEKFLAGIREKGASVVQCDILQAQIMREKGQGPDAVKLLEKTRDTNPEEISAWLALYKFTRDVYDKETATKILTDAVQKFGQTDELKRVLLQDQLVVNDPEKAKAAIAEVAETLKDMPESQKAQTLLALGERSFRVGQFDKAKGFWKQFAEMNPKNPEIRLALYRLARVTSDVPGMQESGKEILALRGPQSADSLFVSCGLLIAEIFQESTPAPGTPLSPGQAQKLKTARQQLEAAQRIRSNWSELHQLEGEICELEDNFPRAVEAYRKALATGQSSPLVARRLVQLLYSLKRFEDAQTELSRLDEVVIHGLDLGKMQVELLAKSGKINEALPMVDRVLMNNKDWRLHIWAAKLYEDGNSLSDAEKQYRMAVEKGPQAIESWMMLVEFLAKKSANIPAAFEVIEQAKAKVSGNDMPLLLAECYEKVGEVELARRSFEEAIAANPKDIRPLSGAIGFYLRQNQSEDAMALIDKLIEVSLASEKREERVTAGWARRTKAQMMVANNDYNKTLEAINLLNQNEKDGIASIDDLSLKAALLSDRADRQSRLQAKEIFEKIIPQKPDNARERFALAKIYEREGNWEKARGEFLAVLGQRTNDARMVYEFCLMLLRHNEAGDVPRWADRLKEMAPGAGTIAEIEGRLMAAQGRRKEAAERISAVVKRPITPESSGELLALARIYDSLQLFAEEERALREFVQIRPKETLVLAGFLAEHGKMSEVMELCTAAIEFRPVVAVTQVSVGAVQAQPGAARPSDLTTIEAWLNRGTREDPKSMTLQMQLGDFRFGRGQYDEAEKLYREFLKRSDATGAVRAGVLNNLSFLISIRDKQDAAKVADARKLVDEAINLVGPVSELLDTRAMISLAQKKPADALVDLIEAVTDSPSGIKYYHLALAQHAAGDDKKATESFARARDLGFTENRVTPLELTEYKELEKAILAQ